MSTTNNTESGTAKLIWLKEGVAATMGVLVIVATLIFLAPALIANPVDSTGAQAIFAVLGGWGGVVIGYYFGRIPAEKAADKAEKVADSARTERDKAEREIVSEITIGSENRADYKKQIEELTAALELAKEIIKKKSENK